MNNEAGNDGVSVKIKDGQYQHWYIKGIGSTLEEAWIDWHSRLPDLKHKLTWWRVPPEIHSTRDFDTKEMKYQVFARFSILECEDDGVPI